MLVTLFIILDISAYISESVP